MKVRDVMTQDVVSVRTDTPFRRIIRLLAEHGVSALPVVDEEHRVLGVVSKSDLVLKEHRADRVSLHTPNAPVGKMDPEFDRRAEGSVAGELMTSPAITVDEDADLRIGARLLSLHGIGGVPVTSRGRLAGMFCRSDVLKAFFRPDSEIRGEIEDALTHRIVAATGEVRVEVEEGVVRLSGSVERRSTARVIAFHVERIDGVAKVVDELQYLLDDLELVHVPPPALGPLEQIL